jgi:hypothetical protein
VVERGGTENPPTNRTPMSGNASAPFRSSQTLSPLPGSPRLEKRGLGGGGKKNGKVSKQYLSVDTSDQWWSH